MVRHDGGRLLCAREHGGLTTRMCDRKERAARPGTCHRMQALASYVLTVYVRHLALVRPLGEGGKLQLAADMAQMELALAPLLGPAGASVAVLGAPYRALRAFRYVPRKPFRGRGGDVTAADRSRRTGGPAGPAGAVGFVLGHCCSWKRPRCRRRRRWRTWMR